MEQDNSFEPLKVTLTVVSGRNLQSKRKGEICHASVVFGLGKELFQTEEVESSEPFWNQEAHVNVTGKSSDSLSFKLKDQGNTIGIVKIPVNTIQRRRCEQWYPLKPYKREKEVHGELSLICFVSEFRPLPQQTEVSPGSSHNSSMEDLPHGEKKKGPFHGFHHRRTPSWGIIKASSDTDVISNKKREHNESRTSPSPMSTGSKDDTGSENENPLAPEVTGISPNEGSIEGNEKVILRGSNLGQNKGDILRVMLVNVDCISTLEYFSSGKLAVTSLPRRTPGSGPVIIETISGGVGVSSLHYMYASRSTSERVKGDIYNSSPVLNRKLTEQQTVEIQAENNSLKQQVKELRDNNQVLHEENSTLKEYVERLLSTIMIHKPELLEIANQKQQK